MKKRFIEWWCRPATKMDYIIAMIVIVVGAIIQSWIIGFGK